MGFIGVLLLAGCHGAAEGRLVDVTEYCNGLPRHL